MRLNCWCHPILTKLGLHMPPQVVALVTDRPPRGTSLDLTQRWIESFDPERWIECGWIVAPPYRVSYYHLPRTQLGPTPFQPPNHVFSSVEWILNLKFSPKWIRNSKSSPEWILNSKSSPEWILKLKSYLEWILNLKVCCCITAASDSCCSYSCLT